MIRAIVAATALVVLGQLSPASAAPLGATPSTGAGVEDVITKVHGYHRSCRWGPRRGWWHRHIGPHGRPVHCGRAYRYYGYEPYYGYGPGVVLRFGGGHRVHRHRRFHRH